MLDEVILHDAMRRALAISRRGPADDVNPRVGCVILSPEGRIVAEGWHRGSGTPHAEVDALAALPAQWRERAAELTAVVTLEPCNHTGRTGPCAVALSEFGIGAVAYALDDPGDASSRGAETLRSAGVEVLGGVLAPEARELLAAWLARQPRAGAAPTDSRTPGAVRPRVTVKWAQTLDGRAAAADGTSQWITGPVARADVHRRRAEADAIMVGTGTLLADDPALTARTPEGELLVPALQQPIPVVVGHRAIPSDARVREHPALAEAGGHALPITVAGDDLAADLAQMHARGVRSVFVEGGPTLISSLIAAELVDELLVYVAPALLGGPKLALADIGIESMSGIRRLRIVEQLRLGDDLLIRAEIACVPAPATIVTASADAAPARPEEGI